MTTRRMLAIAVAVGCTVIFLGWLGYRASGQWRASTTIEAERHGDEMAALLSTALSKDMIGAHQTMLASIDEEELTPDAPHDLAQRVARGFARFPYPESFILWKSSTESSGERTLLFNRTSRLPSWHDGEPANNAFPVTIDADSPVAVDIASHLRSSEHTQIGFYQTTIRDAHYQVIARFFYDKVQKKKVNALVGFTVNLEWIKSGYFPEFIREMEAVSGNSGNTELSISILDETNGIVAQNRAARGANPNRSRTFPLAFFDSSLIPVGQIQNLTIPEWTIKVNTSNDALLTTAQANANTTRLLIVFGTLVSLAAISVALRSFRSHLELTAIKSDFVAMASHELKTPLAGIQLVAETLSDRRYSSMEKLDEYGAILSKESDRLTKLVDKLLTFSRIAAPTQAYSPELIDIRDAIQDATEAFRAQMHQKPFNVQFETSEPVDLINCDRAAMIQVFETLIENSIKYSDKPPKIEIRVWEEEKNVNVSLKDNGRGILPSDIPHVFEKFFRGSNAGTTGTGLGLAIAKKIIEDHGGRILIKSSKGNGTLVHITLPVLDVAI